MVKATILPSNIIPTYGSTYSKGYLRFVTLTTEDALAKGVVALEKTLTALEKERGK